MKKMISDFYVCEVSVNDNFVFYADSHCEYGRETIAYAVELFFSRAPWFCRELSKMSWQFRIAKGRKNKTQKIDFMIPACLMELPGNWVRVKGYVDVVGVKINQVALLQDLPY